MNNLRPVYIIEREMQEKASCVQRALRERRYAEAALLGKQVVQLQEELQDVKDTIKYEADNRNMDKHLRSWFGKILSLSLNEADMAIYHIDMFFAYMKERGYVPVPEWERRKRNLITAVHEYRSFVSHFFKDKQNMASNHEDFIRLLDLVRDKTFTDREKIYYDEYENKAGG